MTTYEILENGHVFHTCRAHSPENAVRAARKAVRIRASDYHCPRGATVRLEWTARSLDSEESPVTITLTARAR